MVRIKEALALVNGIFLIFFIAIVSAASPISELPSNISLNCGESYYHSFSVPGENITIIPMTLSSSIGYTLGVTPHPTSKIIYVSLFQTSTCSQGSSTFSFELNGVTKSITLEVSEDLWNLGSIAVSKGRRIDIGNIAHFGVLEISNAKVQYILSGCGSSTEQGLLDEGNTLEAVCSGETVKINLKNSYGDPFNFAEFEIFSSEAGLILTSSNETVVKDSSECVLGLDTLGAKVKRGNIFAIKTINANTGKFINNVAVTILCQGGELPPIAGISSNIGFFSERLHSEYPQDIIVQLEKEGCEPSTQVILFEKSYDDYKAGKAEEEGEFQLVLNVSGRYEMKEISFTVKNALNEVVEGVEAKITKPDNSVLTIQTDSSGLFKWTPDVPGIWKIQCGKDEYESTRLNEIEIFQNKQYLVVIKSLDGKDKSVFKKGDKLKFELADENNTIIPLNVGVTFAGLPIQFINGVSDIVTFEDTCSLVIPATEGYAGQTIEVMAKSGTNWTKVLWIVGIIIGVLILLVLGVFIVKKLKGGGRSVKGVPKAMEGADIKLP